jgi:hypothetical protein
MPRFLSVIRMDVGLLFLMRGRAKPMHFGREHDHWIERHLKQRNGDRLDALKRGHGYGNRLFVERIWWVLAGHLHDLHPEYEVKDWRGRSYFVDFMWIVGTVRIGFEIMDFGSHGMDRTKYRLDLNRGLFLQSQDFRICYISLDELKENPTFILSALRTILSPYLSVMNAAITKSTVNKPFCKTEREIMRAALQRNRVIRPSKIAKELELHTVTVIKYCGKLVEKGRLRPIAKGASGRITSYEYIGPHLSPELL